MQPSYPDNTGRQSPSLQERFREFEEHSEMLDAARAARTKRLGRRRTTMRNPASSIVTVGVGNSKQRNSTGSVSSLFKHSSNNSNGSCGKKQSSELEDIQLALSEGENDDRFEFQEEEEKDTFGYLNAGGSGSEIEDADQELPDLTTGSTFSINAEQAASKREIKKRRSKLLLKTKGATVESEIREPEAEMLKGRRTFKMIERSNKKLLAKLLDSD